MTEIIIDKVAWTLIKGRKILMVRPRGWELFINPGGKRKEIDGVPETDEQCLTREVDEELSVRLVPGTFAFDGVFKGPVLGRPNTFVMDRCYRADYTGILKPSSEIVESKWFTSADKALTTPTGRLIIDHYHQRNLID